MLLRVLRLMLVAGLAMALAGCFELSARMDIDGSGGSVTRAEIAIPKAVIAEMRKAMRAEQKRGAAKGGAGSSFDFARDCRSLETEARARAEVDAAAGPPQSRTTAQVTTRGPMLVCTVTEVAADPVRANAAALRQQNLPSTFTELERLATGDGYRYRSRANFAAAFLASPALTDDERKAMPEMLALLPEDLVLTMVISGRRIENSNGKVGADGRTVTWAIPLIRFFPNGPDAKVPVLEADIYFK